MSSTSSQSVPDERAYATSFIVLDAALSGSVAVDKLLPALVDGATHTIVRYENYGVARLYLFESYALIRWLGRMGERRRQRSDLIQLLALHKARQSPAISDQQPSSEGAVVVRGGQVVGFFAGGVPPFNMRLDVSALTELSEHLDESLNINFQSPAVAEIAPGLEPEAIGESRAGTSSPRFFNARAPDRVALNAQTYVIVQVAREAIIPTDGSVVGNSPIGDFIGTLTVDVHAPGLKPVGPTTLTLKVPARGDSEKLRFGFVAHKEGTRQVDVMAWNGSAQVAGLTLQIVVEMNAESQSTSEATGVVDLREPEAGEYTLDVSWNSDDRRYRFQLRNDQKDVWPPMYSESLLHARQQTYNSTIANLNAQARNLYALPVEDQAIWLRGMGNLLFEQLVPDKLKALLIEHKSKIRILTIISEADSTPWELLFLADPDTGDGSFLGESAIVARWRFGAGPGRLLKRATKVLVLPMDAPQQATAELQNLRNLLGGADTIGDLTRLNALMGTGAFDLLHFAAHNINEPDLQGGAYVPFGAHQRWGLTFMAAVPGNKFKARAPLVFMNACTTAGTTELYTDLASWADQFLRCGTGAFIGTLWEVRDSSARKFSETFYKELLNGQTLGAAMHTARNRLRQENPGDPTPLAYTLYGNPLARMERA